MTRIAEVASRFGAAIGNWNDRRYGPELGQHPNRRRWRRIDRVAAWLYVRPDHWRTRCRP